MIVLLAGSGASGPSTSSCRDQHAAGSSRPYRTWSSGPGHVHGGVPRVAWDKAGQVNFIILPIGLLRGLAVVPDAELVGRLVEAAHCSVDAMLESEVVGLRVYQVLRGLGHRYGSVLGLACRCCALLVVAAACGRRVRGRVEILLERCVPWATIGRIVAGHVP